MSIKRIEIDESLLRTRKRREKKKPENKLPNPSSFSTSTTMFKNKLLQSLKDNKKKEWNESQNEIDSNQMVNENEFQKSFSLLNSMHPMQPTQPLYGNLKNGNKPTYRELNKTQKNKNILFVDPPPIMSPSSQTITNHEVMNENKQERREELSGVEKRDENKEENKERGKKIKILKKKFTLGKSKIKNEVGILLNNAKSKTKKIYLLKDNKNKPIHDVKKYLIDHNLIKIGSTAPKEILDQLYQSSLLAGNVTNDNNDLLLHNFTNKENES
jgi:hypothetical protein